MRDCPYLRRSRRLLIMKRYQCIAVYPIQELKESKVNQLCSIYSTWENCEFYKKRFEEERRPFKLSSRKKKGNSP